MFRIRRAAPDDAHDLIEMMRTCFPAEAVRDPASDTWWVALEDDEPAGFCCLSPSRTRHNSGYLSYAGVMPQFRGNGLQKRLIRVRISEARRREWLSLVTDTYDNPASSNSLIACGFRLFEPLQPWGLSTALYFQRCL